MVTGPGTEEHWQQIANTLTAQNQALQVALADARAETAAAETAQRRAEAQLDQSTAGLIEAGNALATALQQISQLRAELRRLTTPRPIEEAPKDGTWVLGMWPESNEWPPIVMRWTGKEWQREDPAARDEGYMPTHFLPLPEVKP